MPKPKRPHFYVNQKAANLVFKGVKTFTTIHTSKMLDIRLDLAGQGTFKGIWGTAGAEAGQGTFNAGSGPGWRGGGGGEPKGEITITQLTGQSGASFTARWATKIRPSQSHFMAACRHSPRSSRFSLTHLYTLAYAGSRRWCLRANIRIVH